MTTNPPTDRVTAIYDAIDGFQRTHRLPGLQHAQLRGLLAEHLARALPAVVSFPPATDRGAVHVKQRADCTELEWAEQERARFERLYTREYTRADTAVRDADIYRQRLERLGEGYTRERKRAERAEAESERLRTYRDATCICQHTEQQHFEDACLVCDCGDYLVPEAAREVLRRVADEAQQQPDTETADEPDPDNAEKTVRDHVLALHQIGEQLAGVESWMWEHLAAARAAAVSGLGGVADENPAETDEVECANCWRLIENRGTPNMGGPAHDHWVHVPGGFTVCFPQRGGDSPRAEPQPAVVSQPGKET